MQDWRRRGCDHLNIARDALSRIAAVCEGIDLALGQQGESIFVKARQYSLLVVCTRNKIRVAGFP